MEFLRWLRAACVPRSPTQRYALLAIAVALLGPVVFDFQQPDSTTGWAVAFWWPLCTGFVWLVVTSLSTLIRHFPYRPVPDTVVYIGLALVQVLFLVIVAGLGLWTYTHDPTMGTLAGSLWPLTLTTGLCIGLWYLAALIDGRNPALHLYLSALRGWLRLFPVPHLRHRQTTHDDPHRDPPPEDPEWIDPDADPPQDIPWDPSWGPKPPPENDPEYKRVLRVLEMRQYSNHTAARDQYRALVNRYHPDRSRNEGDRTWRTRKTAEITAAWAILKGYHPN